MTGDDCARGPVVAGRLVRGCLRGPVVAGRPSHGCRHDPARAGPCTQVSAAVLAYETADGSCLAPSCELRIAGAWLLAPPCGTRTSGARLHTASCGWRRAGSRCSGDLASFLGAPNRSRDEVCPFFTLFGTRVPFLHAFGSMCALFSRSALRPCRFSLPLGHKRHDWSWLRCARPGISTVGIGLWSVQEPRPRHLARVLRLIHADARRPQQVLREAIGQRSNIGAGGRRRGESSWQSEP
jgi:hypothetical protein